MLHNSQPLRPLLSFRTSVHLHLRYSHWGWLISCSLSFFFLWFLSKRRASVVLSPWLELFTHTALLFLRESHEQWETSFLSCSNLFRGFSAPQIGNNIRKRQEKLLSTTGTDVSSFHASEFDEREDDNRNCKTTRRTWTSETLTRITKETTTTSQGKWEVTFFNETSSGKRVFCSSSPFLFPSSHQTWVPDHLLT